MPSRPYNFSNTKLLGNVQVRVRLPSMKTVVPFAGVPVRQHTRLPDHRPPLRRDKPVRVSIPNQTPRYIFPSQERSFIFIPRAMRPNQQRFGRSRGSFGYGSSSRRTSAYGGSVYSPSVAASRRSSIAKDLTREGMFSPANSVNARSAAQGGRPVVRLPQGMTYPPNYIASPAGSLSNQGLPPYPPPQTPAIEHYREAATMHQPRPQKTISVSGIDSPAALSMHAPQAQAQQPFESQIPQHMTHASSIASVTEGPPLSYYPYQGTAGTPLSNIPERAIHAQPFQPPGQAYGQPFHGHTAQPGYYYPPMPVFPPSQGYATQQSQGPQDHQGGAQHQSSRVAHESNGMVYYLDAGQMPQYSQNMHYASQENYLQPPNYAVPGMGGMMTPTQEGAYYYPAADNVYYPQT